MLHTLLNLLLVDSNSGILSNVGNLHGYIGMQSYCTKIQKYLVSGLLNGSYLPMRFFLFFKFIQTAFVN